MYQPYKSRTAAGLLALLLCGWGIHHFYLGNIGAGIAMLLLTVFGWLLSVIVIGFPMVLGAAIWSLVDGINCFSGNMTDSQGRPLV